MKKKTQHKRTKHGLLVQGQKPKKKTSPSKVQPMPYGYQQVKDKLLITSSLDSVTSSND